MKAHGLGSRIRSRCIGSASGSRGRSRSAEGRRFQRRRAGNGVPAHMCGVVNGIAAMRPKRKGLACWCSVEMLLPCGFVERVSGAQFTRAERPPRESVEGAECGANDE